jgi:hypothetical protein
MNNRPLSTDQLVIRCMRSLNDATAGLNRIVQGQTVTHIDAVHLAESCSEATCAARELERRVIVTPPAIG